jgi:hypothetical protein
MQTQRLHGLFIASIITLSVGCAGGSGGAQDDDLQDNDVCSISDPDCPEVCVKSGFGKCQGDYDPCAAYPDGVCPPAVVPVCTLSPSDWGAMDPASWPIDGLTIGGHTYSNEALYALLTEPSDVGNAAIILFRRYLAAVLNVAAGADSTDVEEAAADALVWFDTYLDEDGLPGDVRTNTEPGKEALAIGNILTAYNNGEIGPGACEGSGEEAEAEDEEEVEEETD